MVRGTPPGTKNTDREVPYPRRSGAQRLPLLERRRRDFVPAWLNVGAIAPKEKRHVCLLTG